jgi:hypothetical protein
LYVFRSPVFPLPSNGRGKRVHRGNTNAQPRS